MLKNVKLKVVICLLFTLLITVNYEYVEASDNISETKVTKQSINQTKYIKSKGINFKRRSKF